VLLESQEAAAAGCAGMRRGTAVSKARMKLYIALVVIVFLAPLSAQKVKVGYDKSADFSKFKTYTRLEPGMPPTRPVLYSFVVNSIDSELVAKGLQRVAKDGDLILELAGGVDYGISVAPGAPLTSSYSGPVPSINSTMWTGAGGQGELMPAVPDASLQLQFVDRSANQIVWSGVVTQKLDPDDKAKSLELAQKSVIKLLKQFPPSK
jgi:hypothetical protein